jgi:hypothetical protein
MPERPTHDDLVYTVMVERARQPGEPEPPPPPPHPNATVPLINDEVRVWLSSEFVDSTEYFRFDPPVAVYESGSWPLGLQPGRTGDEQVAMLGMRDGYFDWDVACALKLPRRYTGLRFVPPYRREAANLWIRHAGRWNGEPHRFAEIVTGLARLPKRYPYFKYHALYAQTPFCIIGQTWCERGREPRAPTPANPSPVILSLRMSDSARKTILNLSTLPPENLFFLTSNPAIRRAFAVRDSYVMHSRMISPLSTVL